MDTHFLKAVLTAPGDHPRWETDLLAKLAGVPSQEAEQRAPHRPGPDKPLLSPLGRRGCNGATHRAPMSASGAPGAFLAANLGCRRVRARTALICDRAAKANVCFGWKADIPKISKGYARSARTCASPERQIARARAAGVQGASPESQDTTAACADAASCRATMGGATHRSASQISSSTIWLRSRCVRSPSELRASCRYSQKWLRIGVNAASLPRPAAASASAEKGRRSASRCSASALE